MSQDRVILLAEDDVHLAQLTLDVLTDCTPSHKVVVARDGAEALDYLYQRGRFATRHLGRPAVVLLDLKMPRVDGLEVLQQVKGDPQLKLIPVVMLSSSQNDRDLLRSYQLGANGYVVKPAHFPKFIEVIIQLARFWTMINEPPPPAASAAVSASSTGATRS